MCVCMNKDTIDPVLCHQGNESVRCDSTHALGTIEKCSLGVEIARSRLFGPVLPWYYILRFYLITPFWLLKATRELFNERFHVHHPHQLLRRHRTTATLIFWCNGESAATGLPSFEPSSPHFSLLRSLQRQENAKYWTWRQEHNRWRKTALNSWQI